MRLKKITNYNFPCFSILGSNEKRFSGNSSVMLCLIFKRHYCTRYRLFRYKRCKERIDEQNYRHFE